jgi:hypothetical protein
MGSIFHWLHSEQGLAALEYVGSLLMGPEIITKLIGKRLVMRLSRFLMNIREMLNPPKGDTLAKRIASGPVAFIALSFSILAFVWIIILELQDPQIWRLFSSNDPNIFLWLIKMAWAVLFKPACCLGFTAGIFIAKSISADERFSTWLKSLQLKIFQYQMKRTLLQKIIVAIVLTIVLLAFSLGLMIGNIILIFFFLVLEKLISGLALILDQDLLRRLTAFTGFVMFTIPFIIKLTH